MSPSILLIDDSRTARMVVKKALARVFAGRELDVIEADSGRRGLDALGGRSFDLVMLDLTMPEMTGYQFLDAMKGLGVSTKVVVLSADIQKEAVSRVLALGAVAFLKKPVERADLTNTLSAIGLL